MSLEGVNQYAELQKNILIKKDIVSLFDRADLRLTMYNSFNIFHIFSITFNNYLVLRQLDLCFI